MGRDEYRQKLLDPRWQKRRLEILERDGWACRQCHDTTTTLHVHHRVYGKGDPWDVPNHYLEALCENCHAEETEARPELEHSLLRRMRLLGFTCGDLDILQVFLDGIEEEGVGGFIRLLVGLAEEGVKTIAES